MLQPAELRKMVDDAVAKFSKIDVLTVNNAVFNMYHQLKIFPRKNGMPLLLVLNLTSAFI